MNWMTILKRVDIRNADEYERTSLEDRKEWHGSQMSAFQRRLDALRRNSNLELTDTKNPLYKEIVEYRDLRNFHSRQRSRITRCQKREQTECNDYYSIESEGSNRQKSKLKTTPLGQTDPYTTISQESYDKLDNRQKHNYHMGLERIAIENNDLDNRKFHRNMRKRLKRNSELPTFSSIEGYVDTPELSGRRKEILKRRGREINIKRKKKDSVDTSWSKPKIKTDNEIKADYIDKMIGVVESVTHTEGEERTPYQNPKYNIYNVYFDMNKLGGRMLNEWILKLLNILKEGFKQNKSIEFDTTNLDLYTLEELKELVHRLMRAVNPPHYSYLELEQLHYPIIVNVGGKTTSVGFDIRRLMEEQL